MPSLACVRATGRGEADPYELGWLLVLPSLYLCGLCYRKDGPTIRLKSDSMYTYVYGVMPVSSDSVAYSLVKSFIPLRSLELV